MISDPTETRTNQWDASYRRKENFVFWPHEEVVRFLARHVCRRTGPDSYQNLLGAELPRRLLDLGCGIGRHVLLGREVGLEAYGIDLSPVAIESAREWAGARGFLDVESRLVVGDVRDLPWSLGFFGAVVSHGVLDSMPFSYARAAVTEVARVLAPDGLFYLDVVSGEGSAYGDEFEGEVEVKSPHELGTIQSYFGPAKIKALLGESFVIRDHVQVLRRDGGRGVFSRHHVTAVRR